MTTSAAEPKRPAHVSRETLARLEIIVAQIRKWQDHINLISDGTLPFIWERHIEDSLQLVPLAPEATSWLDLGSGGGFPGLVVAAVRADAPQFRIRLVESNGKKCAFLRETARLAALPVDVVHGRIEVIAPTITDKVDVVSARALAPLTDLLGYAAPFLSQGAIGLFPKGRDVDDELAAAGDAWHVDADLIQSQTEPGAAIIRVRSASRKPS